MNGKFDLPPHRRAVTTLILSALTLTANPAQAQQPPTTPAPVTLHPISLPLRMQLQSIDNTNEIFAAGYDGFGFVYDGIAPRITPLRITLNAKTEYAVVSAFTTGGLALGGSPSAGQLLYDAHSKTFKGTTTLPTTVRSVITIAGINDSLQVAANFGDDPNGTALGALYATLSTGAVGSQVAHVDYKIFKCPDQAYTRAEAINNRGQIVGTCQFHNPGGPANWELRGFLYNTSSNTMTTFTYPGVKETHPLAINDNGQIVGTFVDHYAPTKPRGSFLYDGSHFQQLLDNATHRDRDLIARGINDQGIIVGSFLAGSSGFVAVPNGAPIPPVVTTLNSDRLLSLMREALKREPNEPPADGSPRSRPDNTAPTDPNFNPPGGIDRLFLTPAYPVSYHYERNKAQPEIAAADHDGHPIRYMGFNDEGSWFVDGLVYVWNRSQNILSATTNGVPPGLHNTDRYRPLPTNQPALNEPAGLSTPASTQSPSQSQSQSAQPQPQPQGPDYASILASVQPPPPPGFAPYGQNATITTQPDGTTQLSYTLKYPGLPESPLNLPVVRPLPKTPAPGLPAPAPANGNTGSWIWFGTADKQGTAIFFTLEPNGHLTWLYMPSDIAAMYLPPGTSH